MFVTSTIQRLRSTQKLFSFTKQIVPRKFSSMSNSIYSVKKSDCFEVMVPTFAANNSNIPSFPILLTSEHASMRIPPEIEWPEEDKWLLGTHWSYDLGAEEITRELLSELNAKAALFHRASRLVLDPNRPTDSETIFRATAEGKTVKFNSDLSEKDKEERIKKYHAPYHNELRYLVNIIKPSLVMSLHSFTPMYEGKKRDVEVGVLYNMHEQPATSLCKYLKDAGYDARLNEPWSGKEGFMYAVSNVQTAKSRKSLMLEFRNDLLQNPEWRKQMVSHLSKFLTANSQYFV